MIYLCPHCKKPAFTLARRPQPGERTTSEGVTHLDGTPVLRSEMIACDSCGKPIYGPLMSERVIDA